MGDAKKHIMYTKYHGFSKVLWEEFYVAINWYWLVKVCLEVHMICHTFLCTRNNINHILYVLVLGSMAFFIWVFGIEKIPRYSVFHSILAVN